MTVHILKLQKKMYVLLFLLYLKDYLFLLLTNIDNVVLVTNFVSPLRPIF